MLRRLPEAVSQQLRSTFVLSSLIAVVDELVQNCAHSVDIAVNVAAWSCRVADDGCGLSRIDLARLGERYLTSKCHDLASLASVHTFGFRGEALASLFDLALVEVSSRRADSLDSHAAIRQGGKRVHDGLATQPLRSYGTVVQVRDLFYKWPVRRKSAPSSSTVLDQLRRTLEALALIHPHVAFTLTDLERADRDSGRVFSVRRATGVIGRWQQLWGTATVPTVDEINKAEAGLTVAGFISHLAVASKQSQFIYVNKRPLVNTSTMHKAINALFARSSFARHARGDSDPRPLSPLPKRRSPSKVAERWPAFVLALEVPAADVDVLLEPSKKTLGLRDEDKIIKIVVELCAEFLRRHGFTASAAEPDTPKRPRTTVDPALSTPSVALDSPIAAHDTPVPIPRRSVRPDRSDLRRTQRMTGERSPWLDEVLEEWTDPVFAAAEAPIPSVARDDLLDEHAPVIRADRFFESSEDRTVVSLRREHLDSARFIAKIDRKFLLCRLGDATLVLIDQHAADERIRVERFLDTVRLDQVRTVELQPPLLVLLRRAELESAVRHQRTLSRWGVVYAASSAAGTGDHGQIEVTALPEVVADRLSAEPILLKQLITHYLAALDDDNGLASASTCPLGLVELVNSRACRGAIMFGDALADERAERLIAQLAQTRQPFQCAHGRPSLVPIARLAPGALGRPSVDLSQLTCT